MTPPRSAAWAKWRRSWPTAFCPDLFLPSRIFEGTEFGIKAFLDRPPGGSAGLSTRLVIRLPGTYRLHRLLGLGSSYKASCGKRAYHAYWSKAGKGSNHLFEPRRKKCRSTGVSTVSEINNAHWDHLKSNGESGIKERTVICFLGRIKPSKIPNPIHYKSAVGSLLTDDKHGQHPLFAHLPTGCCRRSGRWSRPLGRSRGPTGCARHPSPWGYV